MALELKTYKNSTELANLNGVPIYMNDMMDAALRGKLNVFLEGDTGYGKTQLLEDIRDYFGDKSFFILGRNDMDTRELFQQVNPEFLKALKEGKYEDNLKFKELTDKINYHFIGVDELPNCISVVRAQLFNLFDGFIELDGKHYPIGSDYCIGVATGNMGQKFTESSNELGRALKDRMHITIDTDYFRPQPIDMYNILTKDRNPRVKFVEHREDKSKEIIEKHKNLMTEKVPFEKYIIAEYLFYGLDHLDDGRSKIGLKSGWPNKVEGHAAGSDAALILPISPRATKSIITLSQGLDQLTKDKGAKELDYFNSMMTAFKFVSAYSGILNEALVSSVYDENHYKAMDAVIDITRSQFEDRKEDIAAGIGMARQGKKSKKILDEFSGRWSFMKNLLENLAERIKDDTP